MKELDMRTPVLVGSGQYTQRTAQEGKLNQSLDQIDLLAEATKRAFADCGVPNITSSVDTVSVVRFMVDFNINPAAKSKRMFHNPPLLLANALGVKAKRNQYTATGGNTPQWLVNKTAEEIARGECDVAVLAGAECIASMSAAMKQGVELKWKSREEQSADPIEIGDERIGYSELESRYGLAAPVNTYPLFENALRAASGKSPAEHLEWLGEFFSPFTKVASENPHAWFRTQRSAAELSTPSKQNRFIGYPYTKYLNAVIEVDMAAAVVMMSVAKAKELGVPQEKWVFLHGCGDAYDIWNVSERVNFHSSPAIKRVGESTFNMANIDVSALSYIDLYSCFPSVVQIACHELGIATDDSRGLTVTGGLPYFGGAGNNYVMHSIAEMMHAVRSSPGTFGLCTGNGWYVTKHSAGIYSTRAVVGPWRREDPRTYQSELDAMEHRQVVEHATGPGAIETYTVMHSRDEGRFGIVVGRLDNEKRFLAHVASDNALIEKMMRDEVIGLRGMVESIDGMNMFRLE